MLTLSDINATTNSNDGHIYSDLYKDVYGSRPRASAAQFISLKEFDSEFEYLVKRLNEQNEEERIQQARNFANFVARVEETMKLVQGIDRARAIEIIADAEGELEDMQFYGYERLEWTFNLKFGSIKEWVQAA